MRIISKSTLKGFWTISKYSDSEEPLKAWHDEVKNATWLTTHDVKDKYRNASIVANNKVVFNIHGNKYRLVVAINYHTSVVFIKFIGTHKEYDKIDVSTI